MLIGKYWSYYLHFKKPSLFWSFWLFGGILFVGGSHVCPTHPWWSLGGKKKASWQDMWTRNNFTIFGKKKEKWHLNIFPKGVNLAPTSNSNWELQKGQNWTWMKALEEENKRRKHVTSGGIHTFFPTFPKIPLLSLTTLIWPKTIHTPKNPYMAELLPIFDSSSRPKWSSLTHLNTSHKYP